MVSQNVVVVVGGPISESRLPRASRGAPHLSAVPFLAPVRQASGSPAVLGGLLELSLRLSPVRQHPSSVRYVQVMPNQKMFRQYKKLIDIGEHNMSARSSSCAPDRSMNPELFILNGDSQPWQTITWCKQIWKLMQPLCVNPSWGNTGWLVAECEPY